MSPWFFAIMSNFRRQVTQTFTANATWVAPFTTSNIDNASGGGASGIPGDPGTPTKTGWRTIYITTYQRRDGGTDQAASQGPDIYDGSPPPADYCDPTIYYTPAESTVYSSSTKCYNHPVITQPGIPPTPPTTGASTTAFGKTFPGGTGGPASTTTFNNVAVTPNGSYNIVVPSGGTLTITYWQ